MARVVTSVCYFIYARVVIKSLHLLLGWAFIQFLVGAPVVTPEKEDAFQIKKGKEE